MAALVATFSIAVSMVALGWSCLHYQDGEQRAAITVAVTALAELAIVLVFATLYVRWRRSLSR